MFHPTGLASVLTLALLAERVVTAPAPTPRSDATVSSRLVLLLHQPS